jgi:hypothetical protein
VSKLLGKHFDGDLTAELGVAGAAEFTHPTRTNSFEDFVLAELGGGNEGTWLVVRRDEPAQP